MLSKWRVRYTEEGPELWAVTLQCTVALVWMKMEKSVPDLKWSIRIPVSATSCGPNENWLSKKILLMKLSTINSLNCAWTQVLKSYYDSYGRRLGPSENRWKQNHHFFGAGQSYSGNLNLHMQESPTNCKNMVTRSTWERLVSLLRGNEGGSVGMLPLQEAQSNWGKVGRAEQSRGSGGRRKWSAAARRLCLPPKKQQSHCDKQFRKVEAEGNMQKG